MTDHELLELAAKAAGVVPSLNLSGEPKGTYKHPPEPGIIKASTSGWNPLTDDGDALRLVVKLWLTVQVDDEDCRTYVVGSTGQCIGTEPHGDDPYAATRRAIVRAAAEIGRDKE
jgi:hypothetical protein